MPQKDGARRTEYAAQGLMKPEDSGDRKDGGSWRRTNEAGKSRKRLEKDGGVWRKRDKPGEGWRSLQKSEEAREGYRRPDETVVHWKRPQKNG